MTHTRRTSPPFLRSFATSSAGAWVSVIRMSMRAAGVMWAKPARPIFEASASTMAWRACSDGRQSAAVLAQHEPLRLQALEVAADRHLGNLEAPAEFADGEFRLFHQRVEDLLLAVSLSGHDQPHS
jgi:hypothetical protein